MKAVYLKNFRRGFATNSSSTHSVIYKNKDEMFKDMDIFELDYYDRFDSTIAASKDAKIKYIAANIMWNDKLYEIMSLYYPKMKKYKKLIEKAKKNGYYNDGVFGMYSRGDLYFTDNRYLEASIDYIRNIIDNDEIVIIGGSDETDFVYDTVKGHKEIDDPGKISGSLIKNGNYWVGYGYLGKIRFSSYKSEECIPEYPELIDLKITNKCNHGCPFCFMDSNMNGEDADIDFLKDIIVQLSDGYRENRRVEFSIGGGNVLLYPHLEELFDFMHERNHIINTTINIKDCKRLLEHDYLLHLFKKYVSGVGVSVSSDDDLNDLSKFEKEFCKWERYEYNRHREVVVHLIPELLGAEKTSDLISKLATLGIFKILFLGYKTNGRGITQKHTVFSDSELSDIFKCISDISVDTTFANTYREWLEKNFSTDYTITYNEGEYSMYVDGVTKKGYKSSYQLEKPYDLSAIRLVSTFREIREANGFKTLYMNYY